MLLTPGQKLFEYEIIRPIGQGGFAAVFEARDRFLERHVAIKQLLLNKAADQKVVKRFLQEARVVAALAHPNLVTIYSLRHQENHFYMIMEFLPGGSLESLIKKEGKLSPERAVALTIGICEGLAKFHAQGILHRDIKAENILLTADGLPKVIDFGIAHVPELAGGMALTQVGAQPSTLLYSSPEQVRGEPLDARSDVYQIGELLYYMLRGQHYIDIDAIEQQALTGESSSFKSQFKLYQLLEQAICQDTPPGLKELWREVGALTGMVERALAKDKAMRFKDAAEFAATLKTFDLTAAATNNSADDLPLQNSRLHNKWGQVQAMTRNYEQAIIEYSKAIALDPHYAEAHDNRSTAHLAMGNYGQAIIDCDKALALAPNFVATYVNRGIAYLGSRDYAQALENFNHALELDPDNFYAYFNRGNVYLWMGQYQTAINDYNQVLALNPEFVAAYVNRGVACMELKQSALALADFTRAIKLNPEYIYAYYNRASYYRELRQYEAAIADYNKVIQLNPEHRDAYENRGDCYAAMGDEEQASDDYTRIITHTSLIQSKRLSVAHSMLMPTIL